MSLRMGERGHGKRDRQIGMRYKTSLENGNEEARRRDNGMGSAGAGMRTDGIASTRVAV